MPEAIIETHVNIVSANRTIYAKANAKNVANGTRIELSVYGSTAVAWLDNDQFKEFQIWCKDVAEM